MHPKVCLWNGPAYALQEVRTQNESWHGQRGFSHALDLIVSALGKPLPVQRYGNEDRGEGARRKGGEVAAQYLTEQRCRMFAAMELRLKQHRLHERVAVKEQ
jgi:hypothetical protein